MPGVYQWSVDRLPAEVEEIARLGIPAVMLFGIPAEKDPIGLENFAADGIVQQAIRAIKEAVPEMLVITDVCLCEYTDHGHCGIVATPGTVHGRTRGFPKATCSTTRPWRSWQGGRLARRGRGGYGGAHRG